MQLPDERTAAPGGAPTELRLQREAAFHDKAFANDARSATGKYYSITGSSSSRYRDLVLKYSRRTRVLEYGCGMGSLAFEIARGGGHVIGIDISPFAIATATSQSAEAGLGDSLSFSLMNAERLDFSDESFDLVCGSGILHHLDLPKAYREIRRVLRPGGRAIFFEPLGHNWLINLYRRRTPSLRTSDEHPLLRSDIDLASTFFSDVNADYFHLLSIASAFLPSWARRPYAPLAQMLDRLLLHPLSPLRYQAWIVVLEFHKREAA